MITSLQECEDQFITFYYGSYNPWIKKRDATSGPLFIAFCAYYALNTVVSLIGVVLIFTANRRITQSSKQADTNWVQYALHVVALTVLTILITLTVVGAGVVVGVTT